MKVEHRRCSHCGVEYVFYMSGGYGVANNDGSYCPDCKGVMVAALANVPRKFYIASTDAPEVSYEDVMAIKMRLEAEAKRYHRFAVFRSHGHVFDPTMGPNGTFGSSTKYGEYWLTRWLDSDQFMIYREIYVDANTGLDADGDEPVSPVMRRGAPDNRYPGAFVAMPSPMASPTEVVYARHINFDLNISTDEE